ncbi:MAG TPA: polyphosphate:AMP phosphotransferase [Candidatus Ornithocaccomicrobium faecavium]|uniref:Polyphosphate:AMP phosphotransferase n=1 Tax=Candidatus Ornithocaccomicrobium faecavium TaxID=2840890 RepID=A0A9D1P7L7_9FIRM|nr:polyphosphate:AMP phosphotransferase [Candidatus Ornithocaccomicrobium faecavium]
MFEKLARVPIESEKSAIKAEISALKSRLTIQQQQIKQAKLPVVVLIEGWGAAGKGSLISDIILNIDPRSFNVFSINPPTEEESRHPFLWRYFQKIPEAGQFVFFDSGWYGETVQNRMDDALSGKEYRRRIQSINNFERQLSDNGYLVVKFFLHIPKKIQDERFEKLLSSKNTEWRVSKADKRENKHYEEYASAWDELMDKTDTAAAPWHIIDGSERAKWLEVYRVLTKAIDAALAGERPACAPAEEKFPLLSMPLLCDVFLQQEVEEDDYRSRLKEAQSRLGDLHNRIYRQKIPVILVYEGWDAAGKGGNIKRVAAALDPRGYEVVPIASPDKHELSRHYLWRFWNHIPKTGHIAIFDRSWYGRVMVERIESLCGDAWKRAYREMNEFEKELSDWGAVILKFWLHIDKDTQLERFSDRQNTPEKRWKITDEDWRNREKWDRYEVAVNEMLQKTSTAYAPWHIIESTDKKYARLKVLGIVIDALEAALKEKE